MATRKPYLSKSKLISAWQCPKRLHLEKHHPELGEISANTESLFATGNKVGAISQRLYGTDDSVEIPFNRKLGVMLKETKDLIANGADFPIFEATFRYEGVLIRADVLIPGEEGWHVIEVKASTSVKDYHVLDCAIQDWVMRNSGLTIKSIALAHINNQFVYQGDGNYDGLLVENDLTDDVRTHKHDELSVTLALRYQAAGEVAEAERLLNAVDGPRSAVERAYLLLAEGDPQAAREAFLGAATELEPAAATEVIQLIGLLDRLSPGGVELLSESAARAHRGDVPGALRALEERLGAVPEQDQVALLVAGARMAEAHGDDEAAAVLRQQVLERFASASEAPEAILALARFRSRESAGVPIAITLLEDLILARPNSAVVPTARRELERLRARNPGGSR